MKLDRRSHLHRSAAQALRDLIHAELAHERVGTRVDDSPADGLRVAELTAQVGQARERHRGLTGAGA